MVSVDGLESLTEKDLEGMKPEDLEDIYAVIDALSISRKPGNTILFQRDIEKRLEEEETDEYGHTYDPNLKDCSEYLSGLGDSWDDWTITRFESKEERAEIEVEGRAGNLIVYDDGEASGLKYRHNIQEEEVTDEDINSIERILGDRITGPRGSKYEDGWVKIELSDIKIGSPDLKGEVSSIDDLDQKIYSEINDRLNKEI